MEIEWCLAGGAIAGAVWCVILYALLPRISWGHILINWMTTWAATFAFLLSFSS